MPTFHYRALTQAGNVVSGSIVATSAAEVNRRVEYLGLIPIEAITEERGAKQGFNINLNYFSRVRDEDVTTFTGDLALLLQTGAQINDALNLIASDPEVGRLRPTLNKVSASVMSGESLAEALSHHRSIFPPVYIALVRVGEASGALAPVLEAISSDRRRAEAIKRRLTDSLRYPAFLLVAAGGVLLFFLVAVLPQFAVIFNDFRTRLDPELVFFLAVSDFVRRNGDVLCGTAALALSTIWIVLRRPDISRKVRSQLLRLPYLRTIAEYRRAAVFCRNLCLLLTAGSTLPASLRVIGELMATSGDASIWAETTARVRHGDKLSESLAATQALPPLAIRTLRLGEESGQLTMLAARVAEYYEVKLQRSLDRMMGMVGPAAILIISVIVGGLIVSVVTALLSVNQIVG